MNTRGNFWPSTWRVLSVPIVSDVLSKLISVHSVPRHLRSDNGPGFVSLALLQWAKDERLELGLREPGKHWQNGPNESFNGKFRDECLAMEFGNRLEAKVIIQDWRRHYNEIRPNSRLNYRTPTEFIAGLNSNLSTETRQSSCDWSGIRVGSRQSRASPAHPGEPAPRGLLAKSTAQMNSVAGSQRELATWGNWLS